MELAKSFQWERVINRTVLIAVRTKDFPTESRRDLRVTLLKTGSGTHAVDRKNAQRNQSICATELDERLYLDRISRLRELPVLLNLQYQFWDTSYPTESEFTRR